MSVARLLCAAGAAALVLAGLSAQAGSIPVGASSLIGVLDYSDTFTGTDEGGLPDRNSANWYPLGAVDYHGAGVPGNEIFGEGLAVESCYGNPARAWSDAMFSISKDANPIHGTINYPGGSGGGSATGITQTGGTWGTDFGFEYGLRRQFVVQCDAVQSPDRIDIAIGPVRNNAFVNDALIVFFRASGSSIGEIGVFSMATGEVNSGLSSTSTSVAWHNFAVRFDLDARTIEPFIDEVSRGVINLDTLDKRFASMNLTAAAVNIGYYGTDRFWTDNFQIGAPVPEPGTVSLTLGGLFGLAFSVLRRRRGA